MFEKVTMREAGFLWSKGIHTLGDLFTRQAHNKSLNNSIDTGGFPQNIKIKLTNIIRSLTRQEVKFTGGGATEYTHFQLFLESRMVKPSSYIKENYKKEQNGKFEVAPSYYTRRNENIPVPESLEKYKLYYRYIFKLNTPSHQTSFNFQLLNRTVWSSSKAFLSGQVASDRCLKGCPEKANTVHILIDCDLYAYKMWEKIKFIMGKLHKSINLTFWNIMYLQKLDRTRRERNEEILQFISHVRYEIYAEYFRERVVYEPQHIRCHLERAIKNIMNFRMYKCQKSPILKNMIDLLYEYDI